MFWHRQKKSNTSQEAILEYEQTIMQQQFKISELEKRIKAYEALQQNEVLFEIQQLFVRQTEKGISKYGAPVKAENLGAEEWIQHALEECADNMVYLTALKKKLEKGVLIP